MIESKSENSQEKTMQDANCREVGAFDKLEMLGEGTYGIVFSAKDKET